MHTGNLVRMANQIGAFFEAMPDRPQAEKDLVLHIRKFWDPRMRKAFLEHLDRAGPGDLSSMVVDAVRRHRSDLG